MKEEDKCDESRQSDEEDLALENSICFSNFIGECEDDSHQKLILLDNYMNQNQRKWKGINI